MYRDCDLMTISMIRLLKGRKNAFHGVASPMPLVAILAAQKLYNDGLVYLNIAGGVNAEPLELTKSTDSFELVHGAKAYFPLAEVFDLSMRGGLDTAFLGGVQFDAEGHINNSVIGSYQKPKVKLPGGAGSAVLIPTVTDAILWRTKHDKRSFVNKCDFITAKIKKGYVVTPLCVLQWNNNNYEVLYINAGHTKDEIIENTSFDLNFESAVSQPAITNDELSVIKEIDPGDMRNSEFS